MTDVLDSFGRLKIALNSGGGGWPFANILSVSTTDPDAGFSTVAAALAAAGSSKTIALDSETFALGAATISPSATVQTLRGLDGETSTLITSSINDAPLLDITQIGMNVIDIRMTHSGAGTTSGILQTNSDSTLLRNLTLTKTSGAPTTAYGIRIIGGSSTGTTMRDCVISVVAGTNKYALLIDTAASVTVIDRGTFNGTTADIRVNHAGATVYLLGPRLIGGGLSVAAGTVKGWYYDANGNIIFVDGSGENGGVWLIDESATLRTKEATVAAAVAASASGDSIKLDTDTYSVAASQNIDTSIEILGDGPEKTIYTTSVSNATAFDITTDSITVVFKDLTIRHTGGGVAATGIFSNNTGVTVVLDNAVLEISSGAGTTSRGLWIEAGTWILRNGSKIIITSGTSKYAIYNDAGSATITIGAGCEINGATADIYGDQSGSSLYVNNPNLTNGLVTWAGTVTGRYNRLDAPTNDLYRGDSVATSDFVATINGAPSGTSVVYNAPSSGAENCLVPTSTSQVAKMVLHNTTRSDDALISNCNTGTNTITLTTNAPAGWQSGDTITIRSQTNTSNPLVNVYFVDFEITSIINGLARYIDIYGFYFDTGAAGQRLNFHPYEANVTSKQITLDTQASSVVSALTVRLPLISNRFCIAWKASGASSAIFGTRLLGEGVATP